MPRRAATTISDLSTGNIMFAQRGSNYVVETPEGVLYMFVVDPDRDVAYTKSLDGGISWRPYVSVHEQTVAQLAIWYDRWTPGSSGNLIHICYTDTATDDLDYRTLDVSTDTLSTQVEIATFTSVTDAGGGTLSIARSRGGVVLVRADVDTTAEGGCWHLVNANVPTGAWAARTIDEAVADNDDIILMPGFAADADDMLAIFLDSSANTISRKIFDASANSWAESNIDTDFTEPLPEVQSANLAVTIDHTNSRLIVVLWSQSDLANADLHCYSVTESAITALTDVVTNSTDDQGCCTISIDANGHLYAGYLGKTDGSETFSTAVAPYYRASTDGGTTWGPELSLDVTVGNIKGIWCCPRMVIRPFGMAYLVQPTNAMNCLKYTATTAQPSVSGNIGI